MEVPRFNSAAEMYAFLPPDAQALVRRFTEHPAAACLWTSRRWLVLWGVANGRFADWQDRRDAMLANGLPVRIRGAEIHGDFFAVFVEASEEVLIRSHVERSFELHMTVGYVTDWWPGTAAECAVRINDRWRDRDVVLKISWMGSGGAAYLHEDEPLSQDADIAWLYKRGHYYERGMHISL